MNSLRKYSSTITLRLGLILLLGLPAIRPTHAQEFSVVRPVGSHTVRLITGPLLPIRILSSQSSKLFGEALMPSWMMTFTEPIGAGWYQGQFALGAELITFHTDEPISAYGAGLTPKLVYTATAFGRVGPFVEAGGGPTWTDLGGRVPEQPGQFNFLVWAGAGASYHMTPTWALTAGFRVMHISNGGTRSPNSGLNVGLPFIGLSYQGF